MFPLVIRAGGGSARDSLSVLDQLLAGAGPEGVTYERAVALLGVTDVALIDDMVDALAAGDGPPCSARSTGWSRPATTRAGSPPTCCERLRDLVLLQRGAGRGRARAGRRAPTTSSCAMIEQADRLGAGHADPLRRDRAHRPDRDARRDRAAAAAGAAVRADAAARGDRGRARAPGAARAAGAPQRDRGLTAAGRRDRRRTTCGAGIGRVATHLRAPEQPPRRSGGRRPAERCADRDRRPGWCCRGRARPRCGRCLSVPR